MARPVRLLVVDACVLIDYAEVAPEVLTLVTATGTQLLVPSPLFDDEVPGLDDKQAIQMGLKLTDPSIAQMTEAGDREAAGGGLSFYDWLCLIMARDGGDWIVLSNDKRLLRACRAEGIATTRGLRLLLDLVKGRALSPAQAEDIGRSICSGNASIGAEVLRTFLAALVKL